MMKLRFSILLPSMVLFITPTLGFSQITCEHEILGLKPGLTKITSKKLMLEQGFREIPVRRNSSMMFTNKALWPPENIMLNRQQLRLASMLQDPIRRKALEKRAETDPALKKRLADLPSLPQKIITDVINVRLVLGKVPGGRIGDNETPITQVHADYHFPADGNGKTIIYSPPHQKLNQERWKKYCTGIDISGLRDHRFMDKNNNQIRVCQNNPGASGYQIQVSLQPALTARKHTCSYMYIANPLTSSEFIK